MSEYRWLALAGTYVVSLTAFWCAILWLRPLWLLRTNNFLRQYTTITLPSKLGRIEIPVRFLLLVGFFQHPRVIDAWLNRQIALFQPRCNNKIVAKQVKSLIDKRIRFCTVKNKNLSKAVSWLLAGGKLYQEQHITEADSLQVQQYAKLIAWECLKQTYQPCAVKRKQVLAIIAAVDGYDTAEAYLWYLEKHLGIIRTIGRDRDQIRFNYDLLAEYLASLYLIEICQDNEANWRKFLARVDSMPNKQAIRGFLLAVLDCTTVQTAAKIPSFVPKELRKRIRIVNRSKLQVPIV